MKKLTFKNAIARISLASILMTGALSQLPSFASAEDEVPTAVFSSSSEDVIEEEYIVSFKKGISVKEMKETLANFQIIEEHFDSSMATVKLSPAQFNKLKLDTNIDILEPNAYIEKENKWTLPQYAHKGTNIKSAWSKKFKGKGIDIAVLDSGIANHQDLKVAGGISMVDYTDSFLDDNGHGTSVAGIIASLDNGEGTVGVASEANIYSVKTISSSGSGNLANLIAGMTWAIEKDVDIINISISTTYDSPSFKERIDEAVEKGIIVVVSAGNTGEASGYPALYDNVVAVGSTDSNNLLSSFSSRGNNIDIVAPGSSILSTGINDGWYSYSSGTSMSAPYVTGMLAVYKEAYPEKSSKELVELLYQNALDLGSKGKDDLYGHGLVQFPKELY